MKRTIVLVTVLFIALSVFPAEDCADTLSLSPPSSVSADFVVEKAMEKAEYHANIVRDYRAGVYVKGRMYVRKKNLLVRFVPSMFRLKKGVKEYMLESAGDLHFTAPNIYDQKVKAVYGTVDRNNGIEGDVLDYFHVNVYTPYLLEAKLLSPLSPIAPKHYTYRMDSVYTDHGRVSYRIAFIPKNKSFQLVEGYMIISDGHWSVRELQFTGQSEYMRFDNLIKMGEMGTDSEYIPERYDLNMTFSFLGNVIDGSYTAVLDYHSIELQHGDDSGDDPDDDGGFFTWKKEHNYDLTGSYNLQTDTSRHYADSAVFNELRPLPLSDYELEVYRNYYLHRDTTTVMTKQKQSREFWGQVGDMLISRYTVNLDAVGSIRCSPLINPFLVSYSGRDGFSYKQEFIYNRLFTGDRLLRIAPRIGYNFKHREFYWRVNGNYDYWPRKHMSIRLNMGNGNRIYTSEVLDEIKQMPDTLFDFNKIHLDYFKDFYVDLRHRVELTNGLFLDVGISAHKRTAGRNSDFTPIDPQPGEDEEEVLDKFRNKYISFAPRIVVSWTPGQYYYMSGKRKVNLHSKFPTFSADWERGIKGVFGSTGTHERIEFDMQHQLSMGLMQMLYYRAGFGFFTDQDQMFFVDFENFARNNLPIGWNDEIGGVFQLLDRRWYNASRKYFRANLTYEAPFLLLPRLLRYTRYVLNERIYAGAVIMPHLNPYIELGYGIGTHIFDLGLFVGNTNGKFTDFGFKITFELFNR